VTTRKQQTSLISALRDCGRTFVDKAVPLLEEQRTVLKVDLYNPTADEVINGLFARNFRFFQTFVLDFHLWAEDLGRAVIRMMVETLFNLAFLLRENREELFLEFVKYGIGQDKLYKGQLRKLLEDGKLQDSPELRTFIDEDIHDEIWDALVNIKLKNFADIRKLAEASGLKDEYVLRYQPYSIVVHGHWPALAKYHLVRCTDPLHRFHQQPNFRLPPLNFELLRVAADIFMRSYELWITRYGLEDKMTAIVRDYFTCISSAFDPQREKSTTRLSKKSRQRSG
jgi:hypothetical protein